MPAMVVLALCACAPLIGFSLPWLDGLGSWLMVIAALGLALVVSARHIRR